MKSSYMQFFSFFLPITRFHGNWVTKRHYRSLKCRYRLLKNAIIGLNSILKKIEFQKKGISLISLGKKEKCWIVFFKRAKANFFQYINHIVNFFFFFFLFFPFEIFWCIECKIVLVLRFFFFFFKHKLHAGKILNFGRYLLKHSK